MTKKTFKCQTGDGDEIEVSSRFSTRIVGGATIHHNGAVVGILSKKQALRMAKLLIEHARGDDT
jgi:hypothetical protein